MNGTTSIWDTDEALARLVPRFGERAAKHDREGSFVEDNFAELRAAGFFAAGVPAELGGAGVGHRELCDVLRRIAHGCPATALTASMHSHLVAATVWKHRHGKPGEAMLRRVAQEGLRLVSTGAGDWLRSNGEVERVEGGYRVTAVKPFASGSMVADVAVTSAAWEHPEQGPVVLHFPVPLGAEGVTIGTDWDTLGMRGTGSQTIRLQRVFVPDEAIGLMRPRDEWHPAWSVVLTVAIPLIMSAYVGLAERARRIAVPLVRDVKDPATQMLVGELDSHLLTAQTCLEATIEAANDYDFAPELEQANQTLVRKTVIAREVKATVHKAIEAVGGRGFYRKTGLEQLLRDAQAAPFHPLPEKEQLLFTGRVALGVSPV